MDRRPKAEAEQCEPHDGNEILLREAGLNAHANTMSIERRYLSATSSTGSDLSACKERVGTIAKRGEAEAI